MITWSRFCWDEQTRDWARFWIYASRVGCAKSPPHWLAESRRHISDHNREQEQQRINLAQSEAALTQASTSLSWGRGGRIQQALDQYFQIAAAYYFQALGTLLDPTWNFTGHVYYPPPDPFNALLSFSYSLLLKDVLAAVNQVGFDAYVGF